MNLETKKQISSIRSKYNSTGDVVFRTAILYLFTYGMGHVCFEDENSAVFEHPELFFVRDAYKCAVELTKFSVFNLLEYVQTADLFMNRANSLIPDCSKSRHLSCPASIQTTPTAPLHTKPCLEF